MLEFPRRPSVTRFDDYRPALARMWAWQRHQPDFAFHTQRDLAAASLCSQSHLSLVFTSRRHVHAEIFRALVRNLGFEPDEAKFLGLLYDLSQTRDDHNRQDLRRRIQRMRRSHEHVDLPADGAGLLQMPLVPVVFETMGLPAFDGRADWLHQRLASLASPAEIDAALRRLLERELVERSGDRWRRLRSSLDCPQPADDVVRMYHADSARLIARAIEQAGPMARRCATLTLALPAEGVARLLGRVDELRGEFADLALGFSATRAQTVLQVQIHAIAVVQADVPDMTHPNLDELNEEGAA